MRSCYCGGMADTTDSKSVASNGVWVQVPSVAPSFVLHIELCKSVWDCSLFSCGLSLIGVLWLGCSCRGRFGGVSSGSSVWFYGSGFGLAL